ncbi:MAG: twin-arginine translocase subunit TatC, partial [Deltaproteobacteria bacterium]|nr:twin-arginine translocase subunit TatC [Deltaproteobacteria bacterium]
LYEGERRVVFPMVLLSVLFFAAGGAFGYFLVFPFGFKFFLGFSSDTVRAMPSMKEYLSLATRLLLAFGVVFQLPLFITVFARFGLVSVDFLKKNRKYALVLFFAGAAVITPPDVVTQVLMALPLVVLYELSILGARMFGKKKSGKAAAEEA